MMTTLAFVAALAVAPGQSRELQLTNIRSTYGVLGPTRSGNTIIPGDVFSVAFDIENLTSDKEGKIQYSMGMRLINPEGKNEYKRDPADQPNVIYNVLGGNKIPGFAHALTGPDTAKGEYTLEVTVVDRGAPKRKPATFRQKFVVADKTFGIVQLTTSYDDKGAFPAPAGGVAGQSIWINFWTVGFGLGQNKQPNVKFQMTVVDEKGQKTIDAPIEGAVNQVPPDTNRIPMQFLLPLNRVGKFTMTLRATDAVTNKTSELSLPITVVEQK